MNDPGTILNEVKKAIVGKDDVLRMALTAILARGHILLEDIPGVGKTTMAVAFSRALGLEYKRVQFTPDVLPSDVVGFSVYDKETGEMVYKPGAILCNLFLADELNRATSRTQSALLEAMEENNVTVDGVTHRIPDPFIVIATQNPVGASGTQLLPDSQLDRFMVRLSLGYPSPEDELDLLNRKQRVNMMEEVKQAVDGEGLIAIRSAVDEIYVDGKIMDYAIRLSGATRKHLELIQGASPRATLAVISMAKANAWIEGRDFVVPADIRQIYPATITHRVILSAEAKASGRKAEDIIHEILTRTTSPAVR
ncbi:MAG: MoxR family ATPase [Clostridia bacterium]|nr:MoxR family ATPase [Clostridia bacterium]